MNKVLKISKKIKPFKKSLIIEGDKSLSIRWSLLASQASGVSRSFNLLKSEDVIDTLNCLKKLGIKIKLNKKFCEIKGEGLNGFKYKKNIILNAGNSGTLARLMLGLLVRSKKDIIVRGDKSLSNRDFLRVIKPLTKFGVKFKTNSGKLPIIIKGSNFPKPIKYFEKKGSAQVKSCLMLAALNTKGTTIIKAKKSRNHTEILFKHLGLPIKIKKLKTHDIIKIEGVNQIRPFNYKIPSDISSSAFFIVLTALSKKSKLTIKNININPTRVGVLKILQKMGIKILLLNRKIYKGEKIADLVVKSNNSFKPILENSEIKPFTPYGQTKAAIENILEGIFKTSRESWRIANLRYFNPIGAHESGLIGEKIIVPEGDDVEVGAVVAIFNEGGAVKEGKNNGVDETKNVTLNNT